jgi:hypothetical protein
MADGAALVETGGDDPPPATDSGPRTQQEEEGDENTTLAEMLEAEEKTDETPTMPPLDHAKSPTENPPAEIAPVSTLKTPPQNSAKQPPKSPSKSPRKHPILEPVSPEHNIRKFSYTPRPDANAPSHTFPHGEHPNDPWADFHPYTLNTPRPPSVDVNLSSDQWATMAGDPTTWLEGDHIAYYTWWSQRQTSPYDNDAGAYFPLSFPSGQQASIYKWFLEDGKASEKAEDISRLMTYIWRVVHPPSYLMFLARKGAVPEDDSWYRKYAPIFKDVPMDFNIFSKRVMSVVVGCGSHWVTYLGLHVGEWLCHRVATRNPSKNPRPKPMIVVTDSLSQHEFGSDEDLFVVFLFDFLLHLEKYITQLTTLKLKLGDDVPSPNLAQLGDDCRERARTRNSIFANNPFEGHKLFYQQATNDSYNCGIFAIINVTAVYLADLYSFDWVNVRDTKTLFDKVMKPYWHVQQGGTGQKKGKALRCKAFRYNMIAMVQTHYPSSRYKAVFHHDDFVCTLVESPSGRPVPKSELTDFLESVRRTGMDLSDPTLPTPPATLAEVRTVTPGEALAKAQKEAIDAVEKLREEADNKEAEEKRQRIKVNLDRKSKEKDVVKSKESKRKGADAGLLDSDDGSSDSSTASETESPTRKSLPPNHASTSRQQERERNKKKRQRKEEKIAKEWKALTRNRHEWQQSSQDWEKKTEEKLAGVAEELSLGPSKQVKKGLGIVEKLLSKKKQVSKIEEEKTLAKALATLEECFPVTAGTGETDDPEVSQVSYLKYIPQHPADDPAFIMRHSYQSRTLVNGGKDKVTDNINANWVRWVFEQHYCYLVIKRGVSDYKRFKGDVKKMSWIPVPLGDSRKNDEAGAPVDLMVRSVPLKYQQFDEETCAYKGLASALHYCATKLEMGDKQVASSLSSVAISEAKGDARTQLDMLTKLVKEKSTYWRKHQLRTKQKKIELLDILHVRSPMPTLVVLLGADGGQSHSVTLVNDLVFDSNCTHAMRLSKHTLDWCCNCPGGFVRAVYVLRFWH